MKPYGIHHITAIASDAAANVHFYTQVLGQRLTKKTVNFDDPTSYHLYYGDRVGTPGTALTFFVWSGARRGRAGIGEAVAFAYAIPPGSLSYWKQRLTDSLPTPPTESERVGQPILTCRDPDGIVVEFVESDMALTKTRWTEASVPAEYALGPFHSITLCISPTEPTREVVCDIVGAEPVAEDGQRVRFHFPHFPHGGFIDLWSPEEAHRSGNGAGSIHHVAWRVADDEIHAATQKAIKNRGLQVSPIIDRKYFHSIYFREPGGVLFEVATDEPGFLVDETERELGTKLMLPEWYESMRAQIEAQLEPLP